jgi:hypothetical protein
MELTTVLPTTGQKFPLCIMSAEHEYDMQFVFSNYLNTTAGSMVQFYRL